MGTKPRRLVRPFFILPLAVILLVASQTAVGKRSIFVWRWNLDYSAAEAVADISFDTRLVAAAREQTRHYVRYDPAYIPIAYPGGDVPESTGVCSDVVIRAYRKVGFDLQKAVHEDMTVAFDQYPKIWGLDRPDPNIDHRRVPNLMTYFARHDAALPITNDPDDYLPGDVVAWNLGAGITHIGIVVDEPSSDGARFQIVHNIGAGPQLEDCLFQWKIIGHFRRPF